MPPKRRSATSRTAAAAGQQATLSFHGKPNRITKKTQPQHSKTNKKESALLDDVGKLDSPTEIDPDGEPTTAEKAINQQAEQEAATLQSAPDPLEKHDDPVTTERVLGGRAKQDTTGAVGGKNAGWVGDEESAARKLSDTQIKRYWRQKEQERIVPRVHQEDLTVYEKVLREWDMSAHFGPCIGIARLKRWKRANLLGLKPPIEVLAVLLKQMDDGDIKSQRAHVDELLSSRFIET